MAKSSHGSSSGYKDKNVVMGSCRALEAHMHMSQWNTKISGLSWMSVFSLLVYRRPSSVPDSEGFIARVGALHSDRQRYGMLLVRDEALN